VAVRGDLANPADVQRILETALAAFGRVEILVNSAALFSRTPLPEVSLADWDAFMAVNLRAPFLLSQRLGLLMRERGHGKIVNLADIGGMKIWKEYLPYSVAKAGLLALTRGLAKALAPEVQVNAVALGAMLLPEGATPAETAVALGRVPLGRLGTPEDVVRAILYLLEADFVTGDTLVVDGGQGMM
jgi:NAD(P)-dependent dehydrogenase (short-subunit alcohol dehydrogenase family)